MVTGAGETGAALVDAVDFVMFTGSTRTGRQVAAQAAAWLIPCSLELGGKDETLPIMKVRDAEEAIRLVNDSDYGLQASIITRNATQGRRIAERLHAGAITINDAQTNYFALGLPMGGWKGSGLGVRHGAEGIRKYTKLQSISVNRHPMRSDLHMMPFQPKSYRTILRLVDLLYGRRRRS